MSSDLLLNEHLSDVVLKVRHDGFSWRMPTHSLMLVSKSTAFQDLLDERAESEKPTPLSMHGMKPETAVALLKYIYEDECPSDVSADLLIAAEKYELQPLKDRLGERLVRDMTLEQACRIWEELQQRQPASIDCGIKGACVDLIERHALTIFGSDLVMLLGKMTLTELLQSDRLNIPDEAYVFWGIWRWGRRQCSMQGRSLDQNAMATYLDDLIVLIRKCSLRRSEGIPATVVARFNRCSGPRSRYSCPLDMLRQCSSFNTCATWEDIMQPKNRSDEGTLCLMLSFEKDAMLAGMTLEVCTNEPIESLIRVFRESDRWEIRRERVCWCRTTLRKTSVKGDPESRLEATVTFHEPAFVKKRTIYSVYLVGSFHMCSLLWGSIQTKRKRVESNFVNFHGDGVTAIREVYIVPDVTVTWGPRGPDV